jgi:hypothetical protein
MEAAGTAITGKRGTDCTVFATNVVRDYIKPSREFSTLSFGR